MPREQWVCIVCLRPSTYEPQQGLGADYRIDRCPYGDCPSRKKNRGKGKTTFRLESTYA